LTKVDLSPIRPEKRIIEIDIVRGLALFGILIENMIFFKYPVYFDRYPSNVPPGLDQIGAWFIQLFFVGKFYMIFSFLFGLGFYFFMERFSRVEPDWVRYYYRRLASLFFIGMLHLIFLWTGDILFVYAIVGFILLLFRNISINAIKIWVVTFFVISTLTIILIGLINGHNQILAGDLYDPLMDRISRSIVTAYKDYSYIELVKYRIINELPQAFYSLIVSIPAILALFLSGIYIGKKGVFSNLTSSKPFFIKTRNIGLTVGVLFLIIFYLVETEFIYVGALIRPAVLLASNHVASIFIFPAYIALILLALQNEICRLVFSPVAAAGKMALTNYLSQTLVCVLLFNGFALGLIGQISISQGIVITLLIYIGQIISCKIWLNYFRFGPLEWLWRGLTYKKFEPLRYN
jgi:uncharacterized protein